MLVEHTSGPQSSSSAPFRATQRLSTGARPAEAHRDSNREPLIGLGLLEAPRRLFGG